jgi:hypothetical protein
MLYAPGFPSGSRTLCMLDPSSRTANVILELRADQMGIWSLSLSKDGKYVAFSTWDSAKWSGYVHMGPPARIYVASIDSGTARLAYAHQTLAFNYPDWSSRGQLAYSAGENQVWVDGSLFLNEPGAIYGKPMWAPDGDHILVTKHQADWNEHPRHRAGVYRVNVHDKRMVMIIGDSTSFLSVKGEHLSNILSFHSIDVSMSAIRVLVNIDYPVDDTTGGSISMRDVWSLTVDGNDPRMLYRGRAEDGASSAMRFTPDPNKLAYCRDDCIILYDIAQDSHTRIVYPLGSFAFPP